MKRLILAGSLLLGLAGCYPQPSTTPRVEVIYVRLPVNSTQYREQQLLESNYYYVRRRMEQGYWESVFAPRIQYPNGPRQAHPLYHYPPSVFRPEKPPFYRIVPQTDSKKTEPKK